MYEEGKNYVILKKCALIMELKNMINLSKWSAIGGSEGQFI